MTPENSINDYYDDSYSKYFFKTMVFLLNCSDIWEEQETTKKLYENITKIILSFRMVSIKKYQDYIGHNFMYYLRIIEKLFSYYDTDKNLQKISLEIRIKEVFYDGFEATQRKNIKVDDIMKREDFLFEFKADGKLFYEVFHNLCEISENKELISLSSHISFSI